MRRAFGCNHHRWSRDESWAWIRTLLIDEISVILGSAVEYEVVTLAGRNVGVAARLEKSRLASLPAPASSTTP